MNPDIFLDFKWLPTKWRPFVRISDSIWNPIICNPTSFWPLKIQICPDFRSPLYICYGWSYNNFSTAMRLVTIRRILKIVSGFDFSIVLPHKIIEGIRLNYRISGDLTFWLSIRPDFNWFWYSNGWYLDPHCIYYNKTKDSTQQKIQEHSAQLT